MATYVIGDIQGCHGTLQALLARVRFDPRTDRLWLVGDLVNRGPDSLGVLRTLRGLGDAVTAVLGNHDLHLLSRMAGIAAEKPRDTLADVINAPDGPELCDWLAARPLLYREGDHLLVHAGLHPDWNLGTAESLARGLESRIRLRQTRRELFQSGTYPEALRVLTTIRTCRADGTLCRFDGPPAEAPRDCRPWYDCRQRNPLNLKVFFGHWAAHGLMVRDDVVALDTGCVWGGSLTAFRLDDGKVFSEPTRDGAVNDGE